MEHRELSLISKLDNGLTKGLCIILRWIKNFSLWLLGAVLLQRSIKMVFEYDEGLADISWHEWGFFLLMALLLWRHIHYCNHFSTSYWRGLSRLLIAQGILGVLFFFFMGLLLVLLSLNGDLGNFSFALFRDTPTAKVVHYSFILLTVYLAAPLYSELSSAKQTTSTQIESAIPTVTDEIVQ